jgi:DNA-binding response OmpR family regulator
MRRSACPAKRVLVVDDCRDTTASMALLLRAWGYDVRTANDGWAALALAGDYAPDIVLLDIGLPGLDGFQVARRLRQQPGLERAFVLSLSGYGQEADCCRAREAGCDRHLLKPVDPDELQRILEAHGSRPGPDERPRDLRPERVVPMTGSESPAGTREERPREPDVVELSLLLQAGQVAALEEAAWRRGVTAGELVRSLLRNFLEHGSPPCPSAGFPGPAHHYEPF